jgi:hypothetical protein
MGIFQKRSDLFDAAYKFYVAYYKRAANRYFNNEQYTITDAVGYSVTQIEEIFRPLWGIVPILREREIEFDVGGKMMTAASFVTEAMCEGTDENSPRCFDRFVTEKTAIAFANQAVTEIAGYLVAVYFAKDRFWDCIEKTKRDRIAAWIKNWSVIALRHSWANNHYWYPIICIEILKNLGYDCAELEEDLKAGYDFLESLYCGEGWYRDGAFGRFDYYEAWTHHAYTLLWILIAEKNTPDYEKRAAEYRRRSEKYLKYYSLFFDSDGGMAAYGRSISYRFAAVSPFGLAALAGCNIDLGLAKNIILKNTGYFFENVRMSSDGCFPCGYLYETTGIIETYTNEGTVTCFTEALMCLLAGEDHPLWKAEITPLPIEKGDYIESCPLEGLEIVLAGNNKKNGVTLFNNSIHYYQDGFFGHRFNDMAGYYSKFAYNSRAGFGISCADNVSSDNMISLYTPDGTMASHRRRIYNRGIVDGVLISEHIPFSNDSGTVIKSWVLPLADGFHVRVHRVTLKQPYIVVEGGFSVGFSDDGFTADENRIVYGNMLSVIYAEADIPVKYTYKRIHPGLHLLKPQAYYPSYTTGVLEEGTYVFVSTVGFFTDGKEGERPEISRENNIITVRQKGIVRKINTQD